MAGGRYAPSPTGRLHLGNLRTALLAWVQAKLARIPFILRIDDLDTPRNREGSLESILTDLRWLELDWDEGPGAPGPNAPYLQSQRVEYYESAFNDLKSRNLVYPCRCSRRDIAESVSAPQGQSLALYPGSCRPAPGKAPVGLDRPVAWRFQVSDQLIQYRDLVRGNQSQNLAAECGDFVIRRKDRLFAYQLASVVDDGMMNISDVVRGADLMDSTPRQIALFETLNFAVPDFWHVPLFRDDDGQRMAKRDNAHSLEAWISQGRTAPDLVGLFAFQLGLVETQEPLSAQQLANGLSLDRFTRALGARLDSDSGG